MLVLSRKPGQQVVIGEDITITIVAVAGNKVCLGIEAPDHIRVLRSELVCWSEPDGSWSDSLPDAVVPVKGSASIAVPQGAQADQSYA
jgi:carbon storage regulator CsrA